MKSIRKSSKTKKYIILLALIAAIAGGGYIAYAAVSQTGPFAPNDPVNYQKPTNDQKEAGDQTSNEAKNNESATPPKTDNEEGSSDTPPQDAAVSITAAEQNGDTFQVRATINTLQPGTCTLTLRHGSETVTKTAATQPLASYSTCQGFNLPTSEMTKGQWQLQLDFSGGNAKGSASKTITIQ